MTTQEDLTVQYHQQDTGYYCGAACAQMVLESIGAGLLDQDALYTDNHNHSTIEGGWATGPDGLYWTMNDRRPAAFAAHSYFALDALGSEDAISRMIAWTIHHYQVAPIALVFGWAHWIVVRGYEASAAPAASNDTSYSLVAFNINNPWPPTPTPAPPPPHSLGDACGSGGNRGIADEHITYATWQSDYMTGVPAGHWAGQFVAVCDPEPPPERLGPQHKVDHPFSGEKILGPDQAIESGMNGLKIYGLFDRKGWAETLDRGQPGKPWLVQRLDRLDSFYYIIPLVVDDRMIAAVSIDARYGDYRQAIRATDLAENSRGLLPQISARAIRQRIVGRKFDLDIEGGPLIIRPEANCIYPTLVWKPCLESLSPFYPFYMIQVGSQRIYMRIDGQIFTALHDNVRGI